MAAAAIAYPAPAGQQPDIEYPPNLAKYQARAAARSQEPNLPKTVPQHLPTEFKGPGVWEGATLAQEYDWTYPLSEQQLDEVDAALAHFKCE